MSLLRRGLALSLAYLMIPIGIGDVYAQSYGQQAPPPPPDQQYNQPQNPQYNSPQNSQYNPRQYDQQYGAQPPQPGTYEPLSPDQLDQLVAPVALYPDALLAQVLAASTYPTQVVDADRWMQHYQDYPPQEIARMANGMPWDPSVKSLTAFPSVLDNLARNLDWATQLGNAYYNQPQDVMEAVQAMRQQSYDSGYLRSTSQMEVNYSPNYIEISPANPDVVYVPYYNPWDVYGPVIHPWYSYYAPAPRGLSYGSVAIGFGIGVAVVAFTHWGWGWGHWHPDWRNHEVYHGGSRFISRSPSVFNRGHFGDYDRHYDREAFHRDNNGRAQGFHRTEQFRGRPNANFHSAPQYRQVPNRGRENSGQRQQFRNRENTNRGPQNFNRGRQNFNRPQAERNGNHRNVNRGARQQNRGARQQNRGARNHGRPKGQRQKSHPQNEKGQRQHEHADNHDHGHGHR